MQNDVQLKLTYITLYQILIFLSVNLIMILHDIRILKEFFFCCLHIAVSLQIDASSLTRRSPDSDFYDSFCVMNSFTVPL